MAFASLDAIVWYQLTWGEVPFRLLVAGLPAGARGEPSDLVAMVTRALFIR